LRRGPQNQGVEECQCRQQTQYECPEISDRDFYPWDR